MMLPACHRQRFQQPLQLNKRQFTNLLNMCCCLATPMSVPIALETLCPINFDGEELPTKLWHHLSAASGDRCKTHFLFQHLSIRVQRQTTNAFTGASLDDCENWDEAWSFRDKSFSNPNLMFLFLRNHLYHHY